MAVQARALLLMVLVAAGALAGCLDETPRPRATDAAAIATSEVQAGSFYRLSHSGGALQVTLGPGPGPNGESGGRPQALAELFTPDERVAAWPMGGPNQHPLEASRTLPAGDYVLHVRLLLNGTLELASDGSPVPAVVPLAPHVERIVLAQQDHMLPPVLPGAAIPSNPVQASLEVNLLRPPVQLAVYAAGEVEGLHVEVQGPLGPVLRVQDAYSGQPVPILVETRTMAAVPAVVSAENAAGRSYNVSLQAGHLAGAVVLEAWSFSMAAPPTSVTSQSARAAFVFGQLQPLTPVSFQVPAAADQVVLSTLGFLAPEELPDEAVVNLDGEPSWIAIYNPDDVKLGVYRVGLQPVGIPVERPGSYVAVALAGRAYLGLDAVPSDFQLHPLANRTVTVPQQPAGRNGEYGANQEPLEVAGVAFHVAGVVHRAPSSAPLFFGGPCWDSGARLAQDGETVGYVDVRQGELDLAGLHGAGARLGTGALEVVSDGFGDGSGCHAALQVLVYERP